MHLVYTGCVVDILRANMKFVCLQIPVLKAWISILLCAWCPSVCSTLQFSFEGGLMLFDFIMLHTCWAELCPEVVCLYALVSHVYDEAKF